MLRAAAILTNLAAVVALVAVWMVLSAMPPQPPQSAERIANTERVTSPSR